MKQNGVAYNNLRAEMARKGITLQEIAQECNYNRDTLARWLSQKSDISLHDALKIQETFFPNLDIRYLFEKNGRC